MATSSDHSEKHIQNIMDAMRDRNVTRFVLVGEPGVGKTWIARKVSDRAVEERLCDLSLWVYLNRKYVEVDLCKSIASQLNLVSSDRELIPDEYDDDQGGKRELNLENLKQVIFNALKRKRFLLVLDDEGSRMREVEIIPHLKSLLPLDQENSHWILITRGNNINPSVPEEKMIYVKPLSELESMFLLQERVPTQVYMMPEVKALASAFIERSNKLPTEVILIAKALRCFGEHHSGVKILKRTLSEDTENLYAVLLNLLCTEYDLFPVDILVDCLRNGSRFFRDLGSMHYRELITYWMLEGLLGHVDSIEKAHEKGHHVLLELIDCGILKAVGANHVIISSSFSMLFSELHEFNFSAANATVNLGMATVSGLKWKDFGRIMLMNDRVGELINGHNFQNSISTLVLDGNCLEMEFLDSIQDIQVLALFNPCFTSLPSCLTKMAKLKVVVLRGCDFLRNILHFLDMNRLTILEISGASTLEVIPDDFFARVPSLQSLHLSSLQIHKLPSSLYELTELVRVVVHQCSQLKEVHSFRASRNLEVLDFSGCTSLTVFNRSLRDYSKLQTLNLSQSNIRSCPRVACLESLTSLLLRDCKCLYRLPHIRLTRALQVIDISGSRIREFADDSFESSGLKTINCSQTDIICLPRCIGNVHYLYLRGCTKLEKLWSFESLTDLKELDLSGSTHLAYIEDNFFTHLTGIQILNLSETNLISLPSISSLCNLRKLLLSHCPSLVKLGETNFLSKLEVLDLSGCSSLTGIQYNSFEQMYALKSLNLSGTNFEVLPPLVSLDKLQELNLSGISCLGDAGAEFLKCMPNLRTLDLSETRLERLPSMSNLRNLECLSLRNCSRLSEVPGLGALEKLESLDLSGTAIEDLPSFTNFSNLRHLKLDNCLKSKKFQHLELIKILGGSVTELPYDTMKLTHLKQLELLSTKTQSFDAENTKHLLEEHNRQQWCISSWPDGTVVDSSDIGISVNGSLFLSLLDQNPSLWQRTFTVFHFIIHPVEAQKSSMENNFYKLEILVTEMNFQMLQVSDTRKQKRSLEIFGFHDTPRSIEPVLCRAEFVFLVENLFLRWLCDLGVENIKAMKACWIERCNSMVSLFPEDGMEGAGKSVDRVKGKGKLEETEFTAEGGYDLEVLWITNVAKLGSIYRGNLRDNRFEKLKCLHLECCPELSTLCYSSFLLENLEVLRIKFCDRFVSLCERDPPTLPKLRTLQLWELPKLKNVGCKAPHLHTLLVGGCDMLLNVLSSTRFAGNLKILRVESCNNLESVVEDGGSTSMNLQTLYLRDLPKLKSVGAKLFAKDLSVVECPPTVREELKPCSATVF